MIVQDTSMDKPSEEVIEVYRRAQPLDGTDWKVLADHCRDERPKRLKTEWHANNHCITAERKGDGVAVYRTNFDDNDSRYNWTFANWQALAHRQLMGEET